MEKILIYICRLQWLGLLGFAGSLLDIKILKLFYIFWLLCFIDICLKMYRNADSLFFCLQCLGQLAGIPFTNLRYGFRLPDKDTYIPECSYALPFNGRWFVANGGVTEETSHSWPVCSQRYAYDFYMIDEAEQSYSGDRKHLDNYYCYKQNIIAAADGVVITAKDSYPDTPIGEEGQAGCTAPRIQGNFILIRHSRHEYSLTAHLLKNSVRVKPGDQVVKGQTLAQCGNSGNTSEPHIHFQIQRGRLFLFSAGLPVHFCNLETTDPDYRPNGFITHGHFVENRPDSADLQSMANVL